MLLGPGVLAICGGLLTPAAAAREPGEDRAVAVESVEPEATAHDGALSDANRLYARGNSRFDAGDYDGAILLWGRASEEAPATAGGRALQVAMASHLALAHEHLYDQTGVLRDLERARSLLLWHMDAYRNLWPQGPETRAHIDHIAQWVAELDAEYARATADGPRPVSIPRPTREQIYAAVYADPALLEDLRTGWTMVGLGAGLAAAGCVAAITVMAVGPATDAAPPAGSFIGLAVAGVGGALIIGGGRRKRRVKHIARARLVVAPGRGGVVLAGRF